MADAELDIFGQPVQYDIGQNVLYDEGADDRTITNANDFAATYKNKEQFEGKDAAGDWAKSQGLEYGIDASRVDAFLESESYDPGAYLNNEVDFVVGGTDTDLETQGFQASNPGEMIVTGDENVNATITYPDNVDIFGESAGTTVDAGTIYGTPDLVVGEPVSGVGGFTMLNPGGVSFPSGGALNSAYNILAQNGANLLGANDAARDIGSGMAGDMWIAMYENILPADYVKMVADAFGIEWESDEDEEDEEDDDSSSSDDDAPVSLIPPGGDTGFVPGSGTGSTGIGGITTVAEGPGGSYPNLGYYTDEGYGPYFTPDSSYSSITPFVSPNTGNTLANLYDVGVSPNQFLGGPPTSTTNQPLSSFGYSEDTFAPSVGGIFNLDNFKDLNVKGLTFANYKGSGDTSVITGGVNGDSGGITSLTGGGNNTSLIGGGQGVAGGITGGSTYLDPNVATDYNDTIEDVDAIEFDDGSITGNPLGDLVLLVGGKNLLESGFGAFADYWKGTSETEVITGTPVAWGADISSNNQNLLSIQRQRFDDIYNQQGPYQSWLDAGNEGTMQQYNAQVQETYLDGVQKEFGNEAMVGEETTITQRQANGVYDEVEESETKETFEGNDGTTDIFDDFNWTGDAGSFISGLNTIDFGGYTPGGTTGFENLPNELVVKGKAGTFDGTVSKIIDSASQTDVDKFGGVKGDTLYIGADGKALTGLAKLNAEVADGFNAITPEFVTDGLKKIGDAIPPGVKEALVYIQIAGGGIEAYTNAVKFIDDPEPESALRAAAGVMMMFPGLQPLAIATKAFAEVVDAVFGGYDQQPHRTVYSNIDFDVFEPLSYSQGDYRSDRSASEGVNMFMNGVGELISPDLQALEEEYGIDIKGDLQLAYSDLDGFFYTIGNEDVTGFLERLDARDGGVDIPESNLYRKNLGTFDFESPENLQDQLIEFKETIIGDIRRALDAGYTDFSNFQQVMKDINLGEDWEAQKEATGYNDMELMSFLGTQINPAQSGPNPAGDLFSWGIRNNKTNYAQMANQFVA